MNMKELIAKARAKRLAAETETETETVEPKTVSPVSPVSPTPPKTLSLRDRIALLKKKKQEEEAKPVLSKTATATATAISVEKTVPKRVATHTSMDGTETIIYNDQQEEFVSLLSSGKSCVLIGSAGTGKTTCTQGAIQALIQTGTVAPLQTDGHKYLTASLPGVIIISYTRRAVNNIRKVLPADLKDNAITAHKLLEYAPEYFTVTDSETGIEKRTMRFIPSRGANNPLPISIHTIIIEEASMLSLDLYNQITDAIRHEVQWVFIGDIQQLPPVFGAAILGYKLLELPVVQLTQVYRQALESPIIRLAQRILSGKVLSAKEYPEWKEEGKLTIRPWKKKVHPDAAVDTLGAFFTKAYDAGAYDIDNDIILMPYNKSCGTLELNKHIANHIARKTQQTTYEIMAGFSKVYFSVGDKVLYDKEDAEVIEISINSAYSGARVQPESKTLDYCGYNPNLASETFSSATDMDLDFILSQVASTSEDRVTQSSHIISVKLKDTGDIVSVSKASEVNAMLHSYALTVHKAQGSEWRKVFLCLHQSHATMLQRELLYTAVTRAKEELYVICEPESFTKGIKSQKIKGNTLAEKAEYFKGKIQ